MTQCRRNVVLGLVIAAVLVAYVAAFFGMRRQTAILLGEPYAGHIYVYHWTENRPANAACYAVFFPLIRAFGRPLNADGRRFREDLQGGFRGPFYIKDPEPNAT
ncbi:MAG: hypothetical protein DWQ37_15270 [Planctomycetota bacterium]|nr:MAG: hypothetical protein DWQ37_15270 [Planctomycetota bacterium]